VAEGYVMRVDAYTKGRFAGFVVLLALVIAYLKVRPEVVTLTATDVRGSVVLWLHATDLAPGDRFDAEVWIDDALSRERIESVRVYGAGPARRVPGSGDNDLSFEIQVPHDANEQLDLTIEVLHSNSFGMSSARFDVAVDVYTPAMSWLRRGTKALLAIASWLALMFIDSARRRWYVRRHRRPARAWALALVPVAAAGWFWFAELLEHATRLHGWWFAIPALAVWGLAFRVSTRRSRYSGMTSYVVEQVMVDASPEQPFRGARSVTPVHPVGDLELAWHAAGFEIDRVGTDLRLLLPRRGTVMIPLPASSSLGGEPFEMHASDDDIAAVALHAVTASLGELRAHGAGKQLSVSSTDVTYR
jgi:hypothetical protein